MKLFPWTALLVVSFAFFETASGADFFGEPRGATIYQDTNNPNGTWSGSREELEAIVTQAKANYGFENSKHLGRNATDLKPATLQEMRNEIERYGNVAGWKIETLNYSHQPGGSVRSLIANGVNYGFGTEIDSGDYVKYTNPAGGEAVYDRKTGRIIPNELMGTFNFEANYRNNKENHKVLDYFPHYAKRDKFNLLSLDGNQYKYVGILYERDPNNPAKYYLVDGQTGKRLTKRQAKEFPTTLSDMWRDKGLICVPNDATDMVEPAGLEPVTSVQETVEINAGGAPVIQTTPAVLNSTPATQPAPAQTYETIDYRPMKSWASGAIKDAYSEATGIADAEGFGAEYRARVNPVVNQGLGYIQSIPDEMQVPVGAQ